MTAEGFQPRSGEGWRDPFGMYAWLRDHDPVHHVVAGDYWVLSRWDHVFRAARDTATFSSARGLTFSYDDMDAAGLSEVRPMVMLDPPDHTAFRQLVSRAFTPRRVAVLEAEVRAFAAERIERLRSDGAGDVVTELFEPLPPLVVAHFLGVPPEDRERFRGWARAIVAASAQGDPMLAQTAVGELFEYFSSLLEERAASPGEDTISSLAGRVTPLQVLGFAFTMVTGGNDTTAGLLGGAAELLTARPDQRARLVSGAVAIPVAVEELLRLTSPVQGLARTVTADVEVEGRTIPEGRRVMLLYASANQDPRRFGEDAAELDVGRDPKPILTFSYGAHHCLGAAAARLQGRVVLEELLTRCPLFSVDADRGSFAAGHFVRRYQSLPFDPDGLA